MSTSKNDKTIQNLKYPVKIFEDNIQKQSFSNQDNVPSPRVHTNNQPMKEREQCNTCISNNTNDADALRVQKTPTPTQTKQTDIQPTHRYPTRHKLKTQHQAQRISCVVFDENTGHLLEYRHFIKDKHYKVKWEKSFANELGRIAQGIRNIQRTNTNFFVDKKQVPVHKKIQLWQNGL